MNYSKSEAVAQRCSVKKVFLEISQNSQKTLVPSLFFNRATGFRLATLSKKRLRHRCFPENNFSQITPSVAASEKHTIQCALIAQMNFQYI